MCGNLTPPTEGKPALLTHREVETVFHEFGHLLHLALSSVELRAQAGTRVARDWVELPSQLMENWCWERETLDLLARHYQTGETLPDSLFNKMMAAQNFWAANGSMRQLSFGTLDIRLHTDYTPQQNGDTLEFARTVMAPFYTTPLPHSFASIASFSHLFSGGYAAGYYSYKWSEMLEADAFGRFRREGLLSREVGRQYVDTILSKGNSAEPAQLFRDFMGREPDPEALLERSGLVGSS
jgi:oligopeptidase A